MNRWLQQPLMWLRTFTTSIAYLPSLLATLYILLGLISVLPSGLPEPHELPASEMLNALTFKEHDTPRTLLAALVGGLISLMVFSFTMVMSVLTQAGAQFSHKLLLGLVTERHHQLVLGHYLGSLLFLLINLMVPNTGDSPTLWRSIAVYLGVLMMVNCLGMFIYFIHQASQSVQINAVARRLSGRTRVSLERLRERNRHDGFGERQITRDTSRCQLLRAKRRGYVQQVDFAALRQLAIDHDMIVHLDFALGAFIVSGMPLMRIEWPAGLPEGVSAGDELDEHHQAGLIKKLRAALGYLDGESVDDLHEHGLTQLMEVAIKALSPGINDPGTARLCLHQLTELLSERMQLPLCNCCVDEEDHIRVSWEMESFDSLLYRSISPILHYGRDDLSICLALLSLLKTLSLLGSDNAQLALLQQHADKVVEAILAQAQFEVDRRFIEQGLKAGHHRLTLPGTPW
ncbi:DUF2254 domain-containing protein [Cobetia sp. 3AK]|uniref:DUF2254 domain-containing protein n=1 Tax=Cobetia sp. 3AK TaxID=3040020 RepID=UPI00244AF38E|nr:DUF2254 domain-containing protein [Cobetia sp. 3AK]MDH2372992.1 DUF2254 domain-containing protein [Cobetia sp. 3AK]